MRDHFGWEYKGKHKDLKEAYTQLQRYREALENPPLMVVCDMDRFEVHTNFTGTVKQSKRQRIASAYCPALATRKPEWSRRSSGSHLSRPAERE